LSIRGGTLTRGDHEASRWNHDAAPARKNARVIYFGLRTSLILS